ncbi:site-specific integrase [Pseudolabrys taiwanensis]|uniref:tyrosine-type recombinase/integrase n=1 Tax=Pseudolabrys taiwanensis TaxID=331696 RepID=UPI00315C7865
MKFEEAANQYIKAHRSGWRNPKHAAQWSTSLETYAFPVFGDIGIDDVTTTLILKALEPIWSTKTETANRVRGRIEKILDWARVRGYRTGENPARWKGHLDHLLPPRRRVATVRHRAALPYSDIASFIVDLRKRDGMSARALEFLILTVARTNEVIGALPGEIDLKQRIWTVPAIRTKSGREHRVPLCDRAIEIIKEMGGLPGEGALFRSPRGGPLSNMAMLELLRDMRPKLTVHGFRSTFKDWAAETTRHENIVTEMALAHKIDDEVEAAYRRGDLFEKRRRLMRAWATYCDTLVQPGSVVSFMGTTRQRSGRAMR